MEEVAVRAFCQIYVFNGGINACIAELKQRGFSQLDIINAIIIVLDYTVVDAERIVKEHPVWQD